MISVRSGFVAIVAVALALALGLFVGSASLHHTGTSTTAGATAATDSRALRAALADAQRRLHQDESFDAALAPLAVSGRLAGQSVVVVSAPGVPASIRTPLLSMLAAAGATVTGDIRLRPTLFDPRQDAFLTTLSGRLPVPGRPTPTGSGVERAAAQLAEVLGTRPGTAPVPSDAAAAVLSAYADGQLLSAGSGPARPASLAVVLAGPPVDTDRRTVQRANAALLALTADLDRSAVGAVVVGPTEAAGAGGLIAVARADVALAGAVSTVDGAELPSGRIAAVLALAQQAQGHAGSYGRAAGADAPLPSPSPAS